MELFPWTLSRTSTKAEFSPQTRQPQSRAPTGNRLDVQTCRAGSATCAYCEGCGTWENPRNGAHRAPKQLTCLLFIPVPPILLFLLPVRNACPVEAQHKLVGEPGVLSTSTISDVITAQQSREMKQSGLNRYLPNTTTYCTSNASTTSTTGRYLGRRYRRVPLRFSPM